ncbi:MAG: CvpA family protein [Patescibacteria group bacterium]
MNITDIVLLLFTAVMLFAGWKSGFVRSLGSLFALAASVVAAFYAMNWIRDSFGYSFTANPWFTIITFVSLVIVAHWLAMYNVEALDLARKVISIIPFVNFVNSILGAVLGVLQSAVVILCIAYIAVTLLPSGNFRNNILSSTIVGRAVDMETNAGIL